MKRKRTIRICSQEWTFERKDEKPCNGSFTYDLGGKSNVRVGTKGRTNRDILRTIVHEIVEAVLVVNNKRWAESSSHAVFIFTHNDLQGLDSQILDAMISIGMVDPKKKII